MEVWLGFIQGNKVGGVAVGRLSDDEAYGGEEPQGSRGKRAWLGGGGLYRDGAEVDTAYLPLMEAGLGSFIKFKCNP